MLDIVIDLDRSENMWWSWWCLTVIR